MMQILLKLCFFCSVFFPTDVKLFLLWWCWERCKIVWPCVHKTTRGQGCSSDNCIIYSIYKRTNVSIISNRRTPLFHLLRRRTGWHTKQEEKQNVEFTHTRTHTWLFQRWYWSLHIRGLSVSLAPLFSFPAQWNYTIASIISWRQIQGPFIWDCF